MKLESEREQDPSFDSARLPSTHGENRCREILRRHPADFHDLYRLFAKPPYEPLFGIAEPLSRLLSAEGIERTRPLERVSLGFIQESAEQCALLAERWGACWGRWMNHFGESALVEWERDIPKLLIYIDEDTLKRQPELVFVDPAWLPSGSSELVQAHSLVAEESQSLFLTMRNTGITPLTPGLRMAIENWGVCAYGLVQKCHPILLEGWSDQQRAAIDSIVDILARYDQHRLLPTAFLNMKPDHLGEHAAIFLEAIMIDPAKTCTILEHFPITERQSVRDLALDTIRYCGPAAEEVLVRLGDPRDEFVEQLDLLIRHSGVFGERALLYRRPQEWERRRDEWRSALHQYGHAFWALSAKFRGNVLDMIIEHRSFIDQVFPLCAGGTGKFLHLLPLSLWSSDGAALADRFRESAGDVWEALREDAFEWVGGNRHSDLGSVLLQKGRIRAIHRYLARDKTGDVRFDPLKVVAELLHADKRRVTGKKSALLVSAGTDPRNTFGGSHMARIFHDLLERFDLTVHEARSKSEASESLGALHKRIEGAPLSLRVVAAHGDSFGMQFGGLRHMLPCPADGTQISRENYLSIRDRELVRSWNRHFGPESDLVVLSCSNFSKAQAAGGFGEMLQEELAPARVFGMRWNMTPLSIDFDADNRVTELRAR